MPTKLDGFPEGFTFIMHNEVSQLHMRPLLTEYINIIVLFKHVMWAEYYRASQSDAIPVSCKRRLTSVVSPPVISGTSKPNHMLGYEKRDMKGEKREYLKKREGNRKSKSTDTITDIYSKIEGIVHNR
jgi:hypothetical protein